ncbi:MAG: hypothetical protein KDD44_13840 [Bdellovibrionales bacterium]|nr:hypothetical protein [Bdellovibrionales bacterium]
MKRIYTSTLALLLTVMWLAMAPRVSHATEAGIIPDPTAGIAMHILLECTWNYLDARRPFDSNFAEHWPEMNKDYCDWLRSAVDGNELSFCDWYAAKLVVLEFCK